MSAAWLAAAQTALELKANKESYLATATAMKRRKAELERNAKAAIAVSQRAGFEEERKAGLIVSRARALSAFGGAGADDATVMNIIADIEGEGEYRRNIALYRGEEESKAALRGAAATAAAMEAERTAYKYRQANTLLSSGSKMMGGGMGGGNSTSQPAPSGQKGWGYD